MVPYDNATRRRAAEGGHLEVAGARAREGGTLGRVDVLRGGTRRPPGDAEVLARERVSMGRVDVLKGGRGRPPGDAEVLARERVPLGQVDVLRGGRGRPPGDAEVLARERLSLGTGGRAQGRQREATWRCWHFARERVSMGRVDVQSSRGRRPGDAEAAHENGCPLDEKTCSEAARGRPPGGSEVRARERVPLGLVDVIGCSGGHLEMLKYLHENGCCPLGDEWTCSLAADGGHLEVLKYLHGERGVRGTRRRAQGGGTRRPPGDAEVLARERVSMGRVDVLRGARGGHLEVLKYAHENGCPWTRGRACSPHPRCRPYLIEHGCPVVN